jgi:hypothetical protein
MNIVKLDGEGKEFFVRLAEFGEMVAEKYPRTEIYAFRLYKPYTGQYGQYCTELSGHDFACTPDSAAQIAARLRYHADNYDYDGVTAHVAIVFRSFGLD